MKALTPIKGQEQLMNDLNRLFRIFKGSQGEIKPHLILTGPSGSGKSLTISTLAKQHEMSFIEINAAQLTKEGTSGNSVSKALSPLLQLGDKLCIVFVDEFDKLFISGNSNSSMAHETTTGVQNEFLKILEGNIASVYGDYGKYVNINMKNCLFVFAGAFNNELDLNVDRLREIGLKTEFLGRVSLVYNTAALTLENMFQILEESPLLNKYLELFTDVDREEVLLKLKAQIHTHFEKNTLGARMIHTLVHEYFISKGKSSETRTKKVTFQTPLKFKED